MIPGNIASSLPRIFIHYPHWPDTLIPFSNRPGKENLETTAKINFVMIALISAAKIINLHDHAIMMWACRENIRLTIL